MALSASNLWAYDAGATAGNVNGGAFNTANANFITNYTATVATGNAPVISSASYTFVAGDVGAWIYVSAGTNWTPGFYVISSVAGGAATVNGTIGAAVQFTSGRWAANTVAGCATVASPTGGTCGIDYSQGTAAIITNTDLACADGDAAAPEVTSAGSPFGVNHIGNHIKVTAGTGYTVDWYEIVNVVSVTATLDKAVGTDGAKTGGTFYVGGAISLGHSSDDSPFEKALAGNTIFVKQGTYTLGATVGIAAAGSANVMINMEGFASIRGDRPTSTTRPNIVIGATTLTTGSKWLVRNIFFSSVGSDPFVTVTSGSGNVFIDCKITHPSTTSGKAAAYINTESILIRCELTCPGGTALNTAQSVDMVGCYFHNSNKGVVSAATSGANNVDGCIFDTLTTHGFSFDLAAVANNLIKNCTFYGAETPAGIGLNIVSGVTNLRVMNSIFYGWVTGVSHAAAGQTVGVDLYNAYYNNTTNATNWNLGTGSITSAIAFTDAAGGDFSISSAAHISTAIQGVFPGALSTGYTDYGAVQTAFGLGEAAGGNDFPTYTI